MAGGVAAMGVALHREQGSGRHRRCAALDRRGDRSILQPASHRGSPAHAGRFSMTRLRRLNEAGIRQFETYLQQIREGAEFHSSPAILHVDEYSAPVVPSIEIAQHEFETKFDAAKYLAETLAPLGGAAAGDAGL